MARRNFNDELLHCEICGEDYSSTYRRCPFCGERPAPAPIPDDNDDFDDGYVFDGQDLFDAPDEERKAAPKGGKRLANTRSRFDPPAPVNWVRTLTFGVAILLIIVALIVVFTVIYPKLHADPSNTPDPGNTTPGSTQDVADPGSTDEPVTDDPLTSITLSTYDMTIQVVGDSRSIGVTLDPADWDGTLVWSSSDARVATVDQHGKVTNVNETANTRVVTITVSGGGVEAVCTVYCRGTEGQADDPNVDVGPEDEIPPGTNCTVINASGGLNVRSGPGTEHSRIGSLLNGNSVTVIRYAGDGWYEIKFRGSGGYVTGYVKGEYLEIDS